MTTTDRPRPSDPGALEQADPTARRGRVAVAAQTGGLLATLAGCYLLWGLAVALVLAGAAVATLGVLYEREML